MTAALITTMDDGFSFSVGNNKNNNKNNKSTSYNAFSIGHRVNYFIYSPFMLGFDCGAYIPNQHSQCRQLFISNARDASCCTGLLALASACTTWTTASVESDVKNFHHPISIYVDANMVSQVSNMIQMYHNNHNNNIKNEDEMPIRVLGVKNGDKIPVIGKGGTTVPDHYVSVFTTTTTPCANSENNNNNNNIILSFCVTSEKQKMKLEYLPQFQTIAKNKVDREQFFKQYGHVCYESVPTYHFTYHAQVLSSSSSTSSGTSDPNNTHAAEVMITHCKTLVTPLPDSIQNVLSYDHLEQDSDNDAIATFASFAKSMEHFKGDVLCLYRVPESMATQGYCNFHSYLIPRLPPSVRSKLVIVPHRLCEIKPDVWTPSIPQQQEQEQQQLLDETYYPTYPIELVDESVYELKEYVGYIGSNKQGKIGQLKSKYSNGFELAYVLPTRAYRELMGTANDQNVGTMDPQCTFSADTQDRVIITRLSALRLYEDSYINFLTQYPSIVDWLTETASDVYDTEPSNVECGFDYEKQSDTKATHLQDIAIRRALKRMGRTFKGNRLVQVRGFRSEAYVLNPGQVPFSRPDWICQPERELDFVIKGSIESFWQSNKVLIVKKVP